MTLSVTVEHATAADGSFSVAGATAWDGTGAHTPAVVGKVSAAQLDDTAVTPAAYTNASITVDQQGRLTLASSGTAPVTTVTGTSPIASSGGATPAISLNDTAVTPGTYTQATLTVDAKGRLTAASTGVPVGRFLGTTLLTGATGTFTTNALSTKIRLRMVGPGGGGGGASSAAVSAACAAGGSSGGFLEAWVTVSPSTGYSYTNSAGGAGGANTGATGSAGAGTATLIIGAVTYTVNPGNGGVGQTAGTAIAFTVSGAQSAVSTGAGSGTEILSAGSPGTLGVRTSGTLGQSGSGGSSPFGGGGSALAAAAAGDPALGFGAGGGGALVLNGSSAVAGGDGTASIIVIEEFS